MSKMLVSARETLSCMPSYRSADNPLACVTVRPQGYRRLWPFRWWWPYFQGSAVKLVVTVEATREVRLRAAIRSEGEVELTTQSWLTVLPERWWHVVRYPEERILPAGLSRMTVTLHDPNTGNRQTFVIARFRALEADSLIIDWTVPALIGAGLAGC